MRTGTGREGVSGNHPLDIKKNELKPWQSREWCIPAKANAEFEGCMEDVLDIYTQERDEKRPPLPEEPGKPVCFDREYVRKGTCNIFMFEVPLEGWRRAEIEMSVINNQGLSQRKPTIEQMRKERAAWNRRRNVDVCKIKWRFTTADVRIKLKRLYPQFES